MRAMPTQDANLKHEAPHGGSYSAEVPLRGGASLLHSSTELRCRVGGRADGPGWDLIKANRNRIAIAPIEPLDAVHQAVERKLSFLAEPSLRG
jgi:hypothetical protein